MYLGVYVFERSLPNHVGFDQELTVRSQVREVVRHKCRKSSQYYSEKDQILYKCTRKRRDDLNLCTSHVKQSGESDI